MASNNVSKTIHADVIRRNKGTRLIKCSDHHFQIVNAIGNSGSYFHIGQENDEISISSALKSKSNASKREHILSQHDYANQVSKRFFAS